MLSALAVFMSITSVAGASSTGALANATSDLDYVYTMINARGDATIVDRTDQAEKSDNDALPAFLDTGSNDEYLYLGMREELFDQVMFLVSEEGRYDSLATLEWEYNDGGSWRDLTVIQGVNGFKNTGIETLKFSLPSDWDKGSFNGKSGFWIRVSPNNIVRESAYLEQISARAYNVILHVEDKSGDEIDDLTSSDFDIANGADNEIYAFRNLGDGDYDFALQAESSDNTYTITVDDTRYNEKTVTTGNVGSTLLKYSVTLSESGEDDEDVDLADDEECDMPFKDLSGHFSKSEVEDLYCRGIVEGRSYYYYEPNDQITRAEFLKIALLNAGINVSGYSKYSESFDDVASSDWFRNYVVAGVKLGVVDEEDDFDPNEEINRAEAVTMLVRLAEEESSSTSTPFSDVKSSAWYASYVHAAYYDGVVEGYEDGKFRPGNKLTRGEAAVMVDNAYDAWY